MQRRDVLKVASGVVGVSSLSGCIGGQDSNGGTAPRSTSTTSETTITSTPTETPVPFPETCEPLPDIDELPSPPSEFTEDTVKTFVKDFERVYVVATNDEYGGVESLQIRSVDTVDGRYIVSLSFEAAPVNHTPDADGKTPTPLPTDGYTHRAVYRVTEERMIREVRSHIDDSLLSRTCWTLERG